MVYDYMAEVPLADLVTMVRFTLISKLIWASTLTYLLWFLWSKDEKMVELVLHIL